jgi:hypothetical protein
MEEALNADGQNAGEQLADARVSSVSDERIRIVAQALARILVAKALIELGTGMIGASNKSSSSGVR